MQRRRKGGECRLYRVIEAADHYLFDPEAGGYRLNTDFKEVKMDLGRMFGFAFEHCDNFEKSKIYPGVPEYIDAKGRDPDAYSVKCVKLNGDLYWQKETDAAGPAELKREDLQKLPKTQTHRIEVELA